MLSAESFFGGARYTSSGSNFALNWYGARVHAVSMTAGSLHLTLPPATVHPLDEGGPAFFILNVGANSFGVRDSASTALVTVPAGDGVTMTLLDNSTAAGTWGYVLQDIS